MAGIDVSRRPLLAERDFWSHLPLGADPAKSHCRRLQGMADGVHDGARLVAAMHHAVGAFLVIPGAVAVPIGLLHQLLESLGIAFTKQVAGPLPAKIIPGRIAPRGAAI